MSNTEQTTKQPASENAVLKALAAKPDATAADVADAAGVGRSTASKVLARLADAGKVRRTEGGRDGARRLPDRFALASAKPAGKDSKAKAVGGQLKPGELHARVRDYMKKHPGEAVGPTAVAKALERSSGAVANSLLRLTLDEEVREVSERPRRYELAA